MCLVWGKGSCSAPCHCHLQTEELLIKRRTLLEKKITQELEKAKTYSKAQNKRGDLPSQTTHPLLAQDQSPLHLETLTCLAWVF